MPRTYASFTPLGIILTIMMGAAVAERSRLFFALIRGSLRGTPRRYMTPIIAVVGMVSHHAADAAYVELIPMAAVLFRSEAHTSELQSLMRTSSAVICLKKKNIR